MRFPRRSQLRTFAAEWRSLGGVLATSFREPWSRFRSTFLREHGYARATNLTIAQFAKRNYAQTPTGGAVVKYGFFNRAPVASSLMINHPCRSTVRGDVSNYERFDV